VNSHESPLSARASERVTVKPYPANAKIAGASESGAARTVRSAFRLFGRRREVRLLIAGFPDASTAGLVMERDVQLVRRTKRFVDHLVDWAFRVNAQCVEPAAALVQKVKHRPDSVPERFGFLGCETGPFHRRTVYRYSCCVSSWSAAWK
jgi:hypothetical protein